MITILQGDVIEQLRTLPDESVHCCVTSPPYWGLRDYGTAQWEGGEDGCDHKLPATGGNPEQGANKGNNNFEAMPFKSECGKCGAKRIDSQLGLEKTPEQYVAKMVEVFREVRRVLRKDGSCWMNLGDAYASSGAVAGKPKERPDTADGGCATWYSRGVTTHPNTAVSGLKPKDLCGIPWRVAFALQADGWWLRSDIIWAKPNPMPESVTDRPTKSHEYLFLLTKSASYFYDAEAIKERQADISVRRAFSTNNVDQRKDADGDVYAISGNAQDKTYQRMRESILNGEAQLRNKRSVWTVATAPYPEAHFATYPPDLIKPCILAGTSAKGCCAKCGSPWERVVERKTATPGQCEGYNRDCGARNDGDRAGSWTDAESKTLGWNPTCYCFDDFGGSVLEPCTVLDPFAGSGTTGAVALELGRKAVLIELNPKYVELIERRCSVTMGLPLAV